MSNNNNNKKKTPPPSFSGNSMPLNVNIGSLDEGGEEISRRIAFNPTFEPVSTFEPPAPSAETRFTGTSKTLDSSTTKVGGGVVSSSSVTAPAPVKGIWKLKKVPVLPQFHPLERTAVFVPNASPSDVSMRISDVLRERSIEAEYFDDKAKAKCMTESGVDFRVRLYRGRGERFNHGIIVEVQRRFGTSNSFHSDTLAILDAAEGKVPPPPPPPLMSSSSDCMPLVSDGEDDSYQPDGASSLAMVSKMFSGGYDSHYMALQILSSLMDPAKIGDGTAVAVSTELMRDGDVGAKVLSLVMDKKGDEDDTFNLRSMAWTVVANAFQNVKGNVPEILKEQLRPVLIQELRQADKTPRVAFQVARIAEFLVPQDTGSDLHNALETALEAGTARHAALQRQAQLCLDKLE